MGRRDPCERSRRPPAAGDVAARAEAAESLFAAERYEPARAGFVDVIVELRREREARPDDVEPDWRLARQLVNLGLCLGQLGRFDEAVGPLEEAEAILRRLYEHDDALRWLLPLFAVAMRSLAGALRDAGRWPEALSQSRRVLELHRSAPRDLLDKDQLAVALRLFALVRERAGAELEEAERAAEEAVALHMAVLARTPDDSYLAQIYLTELVQSEVLAAAGRLDAAARLKEAAHGRHLDDLPALIRQGRR